MGARRRLQSRRIALLAIAGSIALHGGLLLAFALRPPPPPRLSIAVSGAGKGTVSAEPGDLQCGEACAARYEPGTEVLLRAEPGEGSTFEGWPARCRTVDSPLSCVLEVREDIRVEVRFGRPPEEVDVAWIPDETLDRERPPMEMTLPEVPPEREMPVPAPPPEPPPEEAVETPEERPEPREVPERSNLKSVEVPDENITAEAPEDARFLSDENRDVEEETRAEETNLERSADGEAPASEESEVEREAVGGPEDVIAHLEDSEPTRAEPEEVPEPPRGGEDAQAEGAVVGEGGQAGEGGEAQPEREPGLLSMRDIEGGEMPGGPLAGDGAKTPGEPEKPGLDTRLSFEDYKRIVGEERVREEQELGRRRASSRKGRWERRQEALRASLENFTPEVRPGNQTALKTRAAPFAVYIARMHRRIHERWGFGFLAELSHKPASHELNDWRLHTKLEIVIGPAGTVERTTIVETSGQLMFDVAAIDAVQAAAPYQRPPQAIRSGNGRVYVHWNFHRDWRQCGTFGAHPFILDNAPGDADRGTDDGELLDALPGRGSP